MGLGGIKHREPTIGVVDGSGGAPVKQFAHKLVFFGNFKDGTLQDFVPAAGRRHHARAFAGIHANLSGVGHPFVRVCVEEAGGGLALDDEGHFPGQVHCILKTGVHATDAKHRQ